jgi:guanylate kinase
LNVAKEFDKLKERMERKGSNSRRERNLHFKTEDQNFPQFRMFRKIQRNDEIKLGVPFWRKRKKK